MPAKARPALASLEIKIALDEDGSLADFLGEYSNSADTQDPRTIDREKRGDMGRGEYPYFIAAMSPRDTGNPESVEQDYQRAEAFNRGDWHFLGIYATAEIAIPTGPGTVTLQTIRSGGLWGIESDSDPSYLAEVAAQELSDLRAQLATLGVKIPKGYHVSTPFPASSPIVA